MRSRIFLRSPDRGDRREFLALARASRALHGTWVKVPSTPAQFRAYLGRMAQPMNHGFLVCRREGSNIVGVINVTDIVLGVLRSGYLGYYVFAGHERQGLMREGLKAVIRRSFTSMRLHRLEANIQPGNAASIALAKACGLRREGYSRRYLKIAGRWRDHQRWAIVAS